MTSNKEPYYAIMDQGTDTPLTELSTDYEAVIAEAEANTAGLVTVAQYEADGTFVGVVWQRG